MDLAQLLLIGLPAFLFFSDLTHIFAPPPPHLRHPHHHPPHHHHPDPAAAVIQVGHEPYLLGFLSA
jgi:hypothetical protein